MILRPLGRARADQLGAGLRQEEGNGVGLPDEEREAEEGHEVAEDFPPGVEGEARYLLVSRGHGIDGEFGPSGV